MPQHPTKKPANVIQCLIFNFLVPFFNFLLTQHQKYEGVLKSFQSNQERKWSEVMKHKYYFIFISWSGSIGTPF